MFLKLAPNMVLMSLWTVCLWYKRRNRSSWLCDPYHSSNGWYLQIYSFHSGLSKVWFEWKQDHQSVSKWSHWWEHCSNRHGSAYAKIKNWFFFLFYRDNRTGRRGNVYRLWMLWKSIGNRLLWNISMWILLDRWPIVLCVRQKQHLETIITIRIKKIHHCLVRSSSIPCYPQRVWWF